MKTHASNAIRKYLMLTAVAALGACADESSLAPDEAMQTQIASASRTKPADPLSTLYHATVRYKDLQAAIDDGFEFLHGCETRGDEGPVGTVYVNFQRFGEGDGKTPDPARPEALIYQPKEDGSLRRVGIEFAVSYEAHSPESEPPTFMGQAFQHEDEFQVWGLHVWLWSYNPEGLFAETNPLVTCN